jgi:DNA-binding response OmpR family regulator
MNSKTILIIEDDPNISDLIKLYCEREGFRPVVVLNGAEGLKLAKSIHPDCVILDVMLPGMDGIEVLKELRKESNVPVIMATAKSDEIEKIVGLELGADDYITKPYSPKELMARIKAVLRRTETHESSPTEAFIQYGDIELDEGKLELKQGGKIIPLSSLEFKLLSVMASRPGHVYSRQHLMEAIYENQSGLVFDRTIDAHIKNLRKKLKDDPKKPRYIESVFGVGYKCKEL